jgi:hypothetical protein
VRIGPGPLSVLSGQSRNQMSLGHYVKARERLQSELILTARGNVSDSADSNLTASRRVYGRCQYDVEECARRARGGERPVRTADCRFENCNGRNRPQASRSPPRKEDRRTTGRPGWGKDGPEAATSYVHGSSEGRGQSENEGGLGKEEGGEVEKAIQTRHTKARLALNSNNRVGRNSNG